MRVTNLLKPIVAAVVTVGIGGLLVWAFLEGREGSVKEQERERPIKAPLRVSLQNGETIVTLDPITQMKSGIVVAPLQSRSGKQELKAYGMVLELQDLVHLSKSLAAAKAQVEETRARLEASRKEYERLKALHDNRNVSDKAFQAAQAAWMSDEASAAAARQGLQSLESAARQQWGRVLAKWLLDSSRSFSRLMQQEDLLLQITLPQGDRMLSTPPTARIQVADGTLTSATLVSPSPRTDPRIQGMSFFYLVPAQTGLRPGMNVMAFLPVGSEVQGVIVPASAVVWWQGKAWVYVQKDADHFVRREISTEAPAKEGWSVAQGLSVGDELVVQGAQQMLSEEFRAQIQVGE